MPGTNRLYLNMPYFNGLAYRCRVLVGNDPLIAVKSLRNSLLLMCASGQALKGARPCINFDVSALDV